MAAQSQVAGPPTLLQAEKRTRRNAISHVGRSRSIQIGLVILIVLAVLSISAPILVDVSPTKMQPTAILVAPSSDHLFGTDDFGRDLFSRVLYGGRISILVGFLVSLLTTITGIVFGTLAGFYRSLDNIIMRVMDILMSFPSILLAIGIMAILGPQLINVIVALAIAFTPRSARLVRGEMLHLREQDFIQAAQALGASDFRLIIRHAVPNSLTPLIIQQTFILALAVIAEATLSFLGVGVPPSVPTLGGILADSRQFLQVAPWMSIFPGLFISLLVLGINLFGDGLRDILDPHLSSSG